MTKKIIVYQYDKDGRFTYKSTLTLRKAIVGSQDFTLQEVRRFVNGQDPQTPYSVKYQFEGRPDGYLVKK